jgi:hypothetical protein
LLKTPLATDVKGFLGICPAIFLNSIVRLKILNQQVNLKIEIWFKCKSQIPLRGGRAEKLIGVIYGIFRGVAFWL